MAMSFFFFFEFFEIENLVEFDGRAKNEAIRSRSCFEEEDRKRRMRRI